MSWQVFFSSLGGMATLGSVLLAWRQFRPKEKVDIATAAKMMVDTSLSLLSPLDLRVKSLEDQTVELRNENTHLKREIAEVRTENTNLRTEIATLRGKVGNL